MKKKRVEEYDIAKGIAILGVIMVHIPMDYRLIKYGIAFHIVVFFTVAGIIDETHCSSLSILEYIKKKMKALLYPYLILSILYIVVYSIKPIFLEHTLPYNFWLKNIYITVSGAGIGTLWFLPTLFIASVYVFVMKKKIKFWRMIAITIAILVLFGSEFLYSYGLVGDIKYSQIGLFYNEVQVILQGLIAGGYIAFGSIIWSILSNLKTKCKTIVYYLIGIGLLVLSLISYIFYDGNDLHNLKIINSFGFMFCTVSSVFAVLFLSCEMTKCKIIKKGFIFFGKNSFIVMTTHLEYKVVGFVVYVFSFFRWNNEFARCGIFVSICILEILICLIVNKTKLRYLYVLPKEKQRKDYGKKK